MPKRNLIWILIILAMAAVLLVVWRQPRHGPSDAPGEFDPVHKTYRLIRESYYQPIRRAKLQQGAVRGMVSQLDEFSSYVPPEQSEALSDRVMGVGRGLGLRLDFAAARRKRGRGVPVIGPLPDSPAHKAGVFGGDRILAVNDTPIVSMPQERIRKLLAVKPGQKVELTVLDQATRKQRAVTLVCGEFPIETVQGLCRDSAGRWHWRLPGRGGLYYVRIAEFCPGTCQDLQKALRSLDRPEGLVLDLRSNPGGLREAGVAAADVFLSGGAIVAVVGRGGKPQVHRAHGETPYAKIPLVVLIDERTASAAEIVAAALSANARAVLVGERTRGKGCVQSMIRLPGRLGMVNLTTAEFLAPPDRPIQRRPGRKNWGVDPQVPQPFSKHADLQERLGQFRRMRTAVEVIPRSSTSRPHAATAPALEAKKMLEADAQLARAVKLLARPGAMRAILERLRAEKLRAEDEYKKKLQSEARRDKADKRKKPRDE